MVLFAAIVRAAIILVLDGDDHVVDILLNDPLNIPALIYSELWVFYEPGVMSLLAAAILAGLAYYYYRARDFRFPFWIGFPIAILVEALYNGLVYQLWGMDDFIYLTLNESLAQTTITAPSNTRLAFRATNRASAAVARSPASPSRR